MRILLPGSLGMGGVLDPLRPPPFHAGGGPWACVPRIAFFVVR